MLGPAQYKDCLVVKNKKRQTIFCSFSTQNPSAFKNEWSYDFNLFKYQCRSELPILSLDASEESKLANDYKERLGQAKLDIVGEREQKIKQKAQKSDEDMIIKKVQQTNKIALQAVQKELQIEELLEAEEELKEEDERRVLMKQIEEEKKKDLCMINAIKQRELESQHNKRRDDAEAEIERIKKDAAQEVAVRRSKMKKKIAEMKKRNQRRKRALTGQLTAVRSSMAKTMTKANKTGDMSVCIGSRNDKAQRDSYCDKAFFDNLSENQVCKESQTFCDSCCENEFGDIHVAQREECIKKCVGEAKVKETTNGQWVWAPNKAK